MKKWFCLALLVLPLLSEARCLVQNKQGKWYFFENLTYGDFHTDSYAVCIDPTHTAEGQKSTAFSPSKQQRTDYTIRQRAEYAEIIIDNEVAFTIQTQAVAKLTPNKGIFAVSTDTWNITNGNTLTHSTDGSQFELTPEATKRIGNQPVQAIEMQEQK